LHPGVTTIEVDDKTGRELATLTSMRAGAGIIIGGRLPTDLFGRRAGEPDVLVKDQRSTSYRTVDVKRHRTHDHALAGVEATCSALVAPGPEAAEARPGRWARKRRADLLQLAHYQRMLEAAGFAAPGPRLGGVIGVEEEVAWYDLDAALWLTPSSMAAMRSGTERKTPRRMAFWVSSRNQRSTRLSQELDVGVKWK
jgi:hypothetical protein